MNRYLVFAVLLLTSGKLTLAQGQTPSTPNQGQSITQKEIVTLTPPEAPGKIHIRLLLTAPHSISDIARSYINREIRNLGDIEVSDNDSGFLTISCIVDPLENRLRQHTGYAISWSISSQANNYLLIETAVRAHIDDGTLNKLNICLDKSGNPRDHFVSVCGLDELQDELATDIAKIDGSDFDEARKDIKLLSGKE